MSFRKMEVGHRFRRIKHNLQTYFRKKTTDEELKLFENVMLRNTKVSNFASTFRKDLASSMTTGFKEENVDKRKKKVEELTMAQNLREASVDLDYFQTSCLHRVINAYGTVLHAEVDEKVKLEMAMERRVYEELAPFSEYEKNVNKLKDKLNLVSTDLEIAQKDLEKENSMTHQESLDAIQMKYEGMKDALVTDIFASSVSKEFQLNEHMLTSMNLKRDYFKKMYEMYEKAIPEVERMIATALPRPVFGVPLDEHLSIQKERISGVLTKCCDFLRQNGMNERGIFRVSGNASKIKRIRAALDAGQFDADEKHYNNDPHAVASTLKAYLRELPDPLTMDSLQSDWVEAINLEGEERFSAIDRCLKKMTRGHRQNLIYLMKFLCDLEAKREETSMNASNLAIVFAPTMTGMIYDGMNTHGVKLTEFMISNGVRIFNFGALDKLDTSPPSGFTRAQSSISPRSFRPKEKAPPPPSQTPSTSGDLINLHSGDDDDFSDDQSPSPFNGGSLTRSHTEHRPNRPPPPKFQSFRAACADTPKSRPISYNIAVGARPNESHSVSQPPKGMTVSMEDIIAEAPVAPERKRLSILSLTGPPRVVPTPTQPSTSQDVATVTDGGDNRTFVSVSGESSSSSPTTSISIPSNVQPPPQSAKPKPPLPVKPKDLSNETSRM
ncbi:Rho-GAP domain-containing protein [Caenorhabditis elegans]|nr:Rho-GAP domain-containing protein [Caenorhabditis elegans]SPC48685.1 Rho-GAP domain-containing protein [Caenorhabditis elegans]|eukprot:NP_001348824.1 Rho GTPase Activating protein [Caenorhabditis elegans]